MELQLKHLLTILAVLLTLFVTISGAGPAEGIGLVSPVSVLSFAKCADGGSLKGVLQDANGTQYHVFIQCQFRSLVTEIERAQPVPPRKWYVGADWNSGEAELLPIGDKRIAKITAVLLEWVDREMTPDEQEHLMGHPPERTELNEMPLGDALVEIAKWEILRYFKKETQ